MSVHENNISMIFCQVEAWFTDVTAPVVVKYICITFDEFGNL
jgi:hypothetical protein